MRWSVVAAAMVVSSPLAAQYRTQLIRADPGVVIDGSVATAIYITMRVPGSYGQPVPRVPLLVIDSLGQRRALATDDAGTLTVMLRPGRYRIVTTRAVEWQGLRYAWDIQVPVRPAIPIIDLTQENATSALPTPLAEPATVPARVVP